MKKRKGNSKLYFSLLTVIFILLGVIIAGTLFSVLKNKTATGSSIKEDVPSYAQKALYTDLGRLRTVTGGEKPASVVIFPVFEYNNEDIQFREELVQKKEALRAVILSWFLKKNAVELYAMPEHSVKKELLEEVNSILNLSKVTGVYFKEFIILE